MSKPLILEVNERFNYSTEEQIVGKWINGKKLYRKTLILKPNSSGEINFVLNDLPDMEQAWFDKSATFLINGELMVQGFGETNNTAYWFDARNIRTADKRLYFYVGASIYENATIYATIFYIKK